MYQSVPGVGLLTAATLVAELPELGHCDSKAVVALVGLAPWARGGGQQRGCRSIRGGRGAVRRALYMAAWSAIGGAKPGKVALVAVMRKLVLQLNAIAYRGTPWTAELPLVS